MLINYFLLLFLQTIIGCSLNKTVHITYLDTIFTTYCSIPTKQQEPASKLATSLVDIHTTTTAIASFENAYDGFYVNYFVNCSMDDDYPFYDFTNPYKAYVDLYGKPPKNDRRIVCGWGGSRTGISIDDVERQSKDSRNSGNVKGISVLAGVNIWSLFGSIPSESSSLASTSFNSLLEEVFKSNPETHTQSSATTKYLSTTMSSTTTSSSVCSEFVLESDEAYPNLARDGSCIGEDEDEYEEYLDNINRNSIVQNKRKISQMCGSEKNNDYQTCIWALSVHMIWVNQDNNKVHRKKNFKDLEINEPNEFIEYVPNIHLLKNNHDERLPVYIVNQQGRSPGVACNALKFIANNFKTLEYFKGKVSISETKNSETELNILTMSKDKNFEGHSVLGGIRCSKEDDDEMAKKYNTEAKKWERDEFPPFSMNKDIQDINHISVTCVPCYDNKLDGCQLGRFFAGTESKQRSEHDKVCLMNTLTFNEHGHYVNENKNRAFPGLLLEGKCIGTDYQKYIPNGDEFRSIKKLKKGEPAAILVNVMDHKNNPIDCTKYEEGSKYDNLLSKRVFVK